MPCNLKGAELENFIRDAAVPYWHRSPVRRSDAASLPEFVPPAASNGNKQMGRDHAQSEAEAPVQQCLQRFKLSELI
jgi:hypothetical protein